MLKSKGKLILLLVIVLASLSMAVFFMYKSSKDDNALRLSFTKPTESKSYFLLMKDTDRIKFTYEAKLEEGEMSIIIASSDGRVLSSKLIKPEDAKAGSISLEGLKQEDDYTLTVNQNSTRKSSVIIECEPEAVFFYKDKDGKEKYYRMSGVKSTNYERK